MSADRSSLIPSLQTIAARLRIESVRSTSEAGSGHPSSCCSAADIVSALFFAEMRFDPLDPQHDDNDRFVLSKGHAAPLLYAAWAEAGFVKAHADLLNLAHARERSRRASDPTDYRSSTSRQGSLGQGICAAVGLALNARRLRSGSRVVCADRVTASRRKARSGKLRRPASTSALDNLCGITDVNALGQSRGTQWGHNMEALRAALAAPPAGMPSSLMGMTLARC